MELESTNEKEALSRVEKVNSERAKFIQKLFNRSVTDESYYDLVLNSDRFSNQQMADVICVCMKSAGFPVPELVER